MIDINSKYNNVVKNRRLLLERSAKDIMRYSAGRPTSDSLSVMSDITKSNLNPSNPDELFKNVFANIGEVYTIKSIIKELGIMGKNINVSNDVSIIYQKEFIDEQFADAVATGPDMQKSQKGEGENEEIPLYDIKHYMGFDNVVSNSFNIKNEESLRFRNPNFAIIKIKDHSMSFLRSKESAYVPFIGTMIPAIEMSKCVPHLNVSIVDDDPNIENVVSLSKFLVGRKNFEKDGTAVGLSKMSFVERQDLVLSTTSNISNVRAGKKVSQNVSGMEVFQSPQSMINSDINKFQTGKNRVLNPFLPFMSIESFSINDELQPLDFISTTSGTLSLKLFDRSRIPEISKLVGRDYLAGIFLIIEFGWSHPDGSIISNNPFGQFLNSLKRREVFVVQDSSININDDGTAGIKLSIVSLGHDTVMNSSMGQKYLDIETLSLYQKSVEKKLKETMGTLHKTDLKTSIKKTPYLNHFTTNDLVSLEALGESFSNSTAGFFGDYYYIISQAIDSESDKDALIKKIQEFNNNIERVLSQNPYKKEEKKEPKVDQDRSLVDVKFIVDGALAPGKYNGDLWNALSDLSSVKEEVTEGGVTYVKRPPLSDTEIVNYLINAKTFVEKTDPESEEVYTKETLKYDISSIRGILDGQGWGPERIQKAFNAVGLKDETIDKQVADRLQSNVYSSTARKIRDLLKFIDYGDGLWDTSTGYSRTGNAQSDQTGFEGALKNRDTSTILARLSKINPDLSISDVYTRNMTYKLTFEGGKIDKTELLSESLNVSKFITLGRLLGYVYGLNATMERKHEEVQMFFHPANQQAGAFNNISLGDVFISTEKYLNEITKLIEKRKSAKLTQKDEIKIIRNILMSGEYEIGYGVSTYASKLGKNEKNKDKIKEDQEAKEQFNVSMNKKLMSIYEFSPDEEPKTLLFKPIDLAISLETLPYVENDIYKNLLRIHVYDKNSEAYYPESLLLQSVNSTSIESVLNTLSFRLSNKLYSKKSFNDFTSTNINNLQLVQTLAESSEEQLALLIAENSKKFKIINDQIANQIETIIKASVPTLEMGSDNGFVQQMSLSNNNGSLATELNTIDYVTSLSNPQNNDRERKRQRLILVPGSLSVTVMGFPIISMGQTFYVTAKTNTTLDNIYRVYGITHSISEGNFLTTISLESTMSGVYDSTNITKSISNIRSYSSQQF